MKTHTSIDVLLKFAEHHTPVIVKYATNSELRAFCYCDTSGLKDCRECCAYTLCNSVSPSFLPTLTQEEAEIVVKDHPELFI